MSFPSVCTVVFITSIGYKPTPHVIRTARTYDARYTIHHEPHSLMFSERDGGKGYCCSNLMFCEPQSGKIGSR